MSVCACDREKPASCARTTSTRSPEFSAEIVKDGKRNSGF